MSSDTPEPEPKIEERAQELYKMAYERVAGMLAMYQVRKYPKTRVQALPSYANAEDYEFFKSLTGDVAMISLTYGECLAYLVCIERILEDNGYKSQRVNISRTEFDNYVAEVESGQ